MKEYPEYLITAFITSCKRAEILKLAGIGKTKYYKLKNDPEFQQVVSERRGELVKEAVLRMESYLTEDIEILQSIIRDENASDQVRINGINLLMSQLGQWKALTDLQERMKRIEDAQARMRSV